MVQPQTPLRVLTALSMSLSWYGSVQEGGNARQVWLRKYTYLTLNVNGWKCNVYYTCRIYNSCSCAIILTHLGDEMLDGGGGGGGGVVSYPDPYVRNAYSVSDNHRYVHMGLGTRLGGGGGGGGGGGLFIIIIIA